MDNPQIREQFECATCMSRLIVCWPNPGLYADQDWAPDDLMCMACGDDMHHRALELDDGAENAPARLSTAGTGLLAAITAVEEE
jgi:hypothetical protein